MEGGWAPPPPVRKMPIALRLFLCGRLPYNWLHFLMVMKMMMMTSELRRINWKVFGQTLRKAESETSERTNKPRPWEEPMSHLLMTKVPNHKFWSRLFGTHLNPKPRDSASSGNPLSWVWPNSHPESCYRCPHQVVLFRRKNTATWFQFHRAWKSNMASILTPSFPLKRCLSFRDIETFFSIFLSHS